MLSFKQFINEHGNPRDYVEKHGIPPAPKSTHKWIKDNWHKRVTGNKNYLKTGKLDHLEKHEDIPVHKIRSSDFQHHVDAQYVNHLTKSLKKKGKFAKPITVFHHKGLYVVDDGHHRVSAARSAGHKTIRAEVNYLDRDKE